MLRLIEFGLLGVSLLVIIALIVTGRRKNPDQPEAQSSPLTSDGSERPKPKAR